MTIDALRATVNISQTLINWDLSIFGGSLAVMLTSQLKKPKNWIKYLYFFFLPAWTCFIMSLNYGSQIAGSGVMIELYNGNEGRLNEIFKTMSFDYKSQIVYLKLGLGFLAIWLTAYLFWFVFLERENEN